MYEVDWNSCIEPQSSRVFHLMMKARSRRVSHVTVSLRGVGVRQSFVRINVKAGKLSEITNFITRVSFTGRM